MRSLQFLIKSRDILEKLQKRDADLLLKQAEELLKNYPEQALSHYVMALCMYQKEDIPGTFNYLVKTLKLDPSFVSAAENLLELNKDNFSIGECKYLYSLIAAHKNIPEEGRQTLQRFPDQPLKTELTMQLSEKREEAAVDSVPGRDDDAYIQHLLTEMEYQDKIEIELPHAAEKSRQSREAAEDVMILSGDSSDGKAASQQERPKSAASPETGGNVYQLPRRQAAAQNSKLNTAISYSVETMTMAQLYIRQGLYEHALDILLKLQKRNPESERICHEIERVKQLINEERN